MNPVDDIRSATHNPQKVETNVISLAYLPWLCCWESEGKREEESCRAARCKFILGRK